MPLDAQVRRHVRAALAAITPPASAAASAGEPVPSDGPRLSAAGRRLWQRVNKLSGMGLVHNPPDRDAIELACYALQLPLRRWEILPIGRLGLMNLRDRAERAAQRLVEEVGEHIDPDLLDRTTRLLHETPQRPPIVEEAKLLADAVNLDDFGTIGLLSQTAELALRGEGMDVLAESWHKREAYGYWQARLNDGFHFPAVRAIARRRIDNARRVIQMLEEERREDDGNGGGELRK